MRHIYPSAYRDFSCIASACRHTCCVGWELPVDARTARRYRKMRGALGDTIRTSLCDSYDAFLPTQEGRCPHLDANNLCRLITDGSQRLLCTVCREHPRYHNRYGIATEHGLGLCCEEACRLLLTAPLSFAFGDGTPVVPDAFSHGRSALYLRDKYRLLDAIVAFEGTAEECIAHLGAHLGACAAASDMISSLKMLGALEYLEQGSARIFSHITTFSAIFDKNSLQYRNFLALTLYRTATRETDLSVAFTLSVFLLRLLDALVKNAPKNDLDTLLDLARLISAELEYSEDNTQTLLSHFEEKALLRSYQEQQ